MISKNSSLLLGNMAHFQVEMQYILVLIEEFNESLSELVRVISEFIIPQVQGYQMCTVYDRFDQIYNPFICELVPLDGKLFNDILREQLSEEGH